MEPLKLSLSMEEISTVLTTSGLAMVGLGQVLVVLVSRTDDDGAVDVAVAAAVAVVVVGGGGGGGVVVGSGGLRNRDFSSSKAASRLARSSLATANT